jgi:hypothetical protein
VSGAACTKRRTSGRTRPSACTATAAQAPISATQPRDQHLPKVQVTPEGTYLVAITLSRYEASLGPLESLFYIPLFNGSYTNTDLHSFALFSIAAYSTFDLASTFCPYLHALYRQPLAISVLRLLPGFPVPSYSCCYLTALRLEDNDLWN